MNILKQLTEDKKNEPQIPEMKVKRMNPLATVPTFGSDGAAGMDLYSLNDMEIKPQTSEIIHTGVAVEIPQGYVGLVFGRSGLGIKKNIRPSNCVGVIDCDYRGEIMVSLHNDSDTAYKVKFGDRIAQMVLTPYLHTNIIEVDELDSTERGANGFGSTGK